MKKITVVASLLLLSTASLAHAKYEKVCRYKTDRYGRQVRKCSYVQTAHNHRRHHDNYGDGFFDGMIASSYLLLTTSDILDGDDKASALQNEASMHLAALAKGIEMAMSQELSVLVDQTRLEVEELANASDREVLEFIKSKM